MSLAGAGWCREVTLQQEQAEWLRRLPGVLEYAGRIIDEVPQLGAKGYFVTDISNLFKRMEIHSQTALRLFQGTERQGYSPGKLQFDFGSAHLIARAMTELAVLMEFVFCDKSAKFDELKFRHAIWRVAGYLERRSWLSRPSSSRKGKKIGELEPKAETENEARILKWQRQIQSSSYFGKLVSPERRNHALNGKLHAVYGQKAVISLGRKLSFKEAYVGHAFSLNSNYSHSTSITAFQGQEAFFKPEEELRLCLPPSIQTFSMLARGIRCMKLRFPKLGSRLPIAQSVNQNFDLLFQWSSEQ